MSDHINIAGVHPDTLEAVTRAHQIRVLLNKLESQQERIAALESVLRELVEQGYTDLLQNGWGCRYCEALYDTAIDGIEHAPDCVIVKAKALLNDTANK